MYLNIYVYLITANISTRNSLTFINLFKEYLVNVVSCAPLQITPE